MSKHRELPPPTDPFADREAQKYGQPVPSREYIIQHLRYMGTPTTLEKLAEVLKLTDEQSIEALRRRLQAMKRDGELIVSRRKGYRLSKSKKLDFDLVRGRVIAHPDGYGFLVPDEGGEDLLLFEKEMSSVLHGDRILVKTTGGDYRGRRLGVLVEILERNTHEVVGRFFQLKGKIAFVEPDNPRLYQRVLIPTRKRGKAKNGQVVVAKLIAQPTPTEPPIGHIVEILGDYCAPGMEMEIAARSCGIPQQWPDEVLQEIKDLKDEPLPAEACAKRDDLRALPFVTIDGEDAQDFDDAVYCEPRGKGWRLLVAIADVSSYVLPDTALDAEALRRGNSVYFPNKVIPMLPEVLSNSLCSLKPHVERLTLVCEILIDVYGRIRSTHFLEAVICSAARLTYTEVANVLVQQESTFRYPNLLPQLKNLYQLYHLLRKRRQKRGSIDFDTVETRIIFNAQQKIEQIVPVVRNDAHRLIEEMMLIANVATAQWLKARQMPLLYRVHEGPTAEKLTDLNGFLKTLGLRLGGGETPETAHYARLLEKISTRPEARLIQTVLLRSMQMAIYSPENKGHFGLAYETYTHFTSPIRRYPDLLVHRAIKHCLQKKSIKEFPYSFVKMISLGEHCSKTERRADDATRDVINSLKCQYMQNKVGTVFSGLITGVTSFGMFVEVTDFSVEGLIHITSLEGDYYHFDPIGRRLCGESSGKVYRLSDQVRVKLIRVNLEEKKLDFELA